MLRVFLNGFKNIPGKACVNRVHNNYAFVNVGKISLREKHRILMRSVLSGNKTPHTNKEEVIDIKSLHVMYYRPFDRSMGL